MKKVGYFDAQNHIIRLDAIFSLSHPKEGQSKILKERNIIPSSKGKIVDMEIEGKIWKEGKSWLVEMASLDAMTQGRTRKNALAMAKDLVFEMMLSYFKDELDKDFKVTINDYNEDVFGITTSETKLLLALTLRRQRERSRSPTPTPD